MIWPFFFFFHSYTHTHTHILFEDFNLHKKEPWTEKHTEYYASLIWFNDSDDSSTFCRCDRTARYWMRSDLEFRLWNVLTGSPCAWWKYKQNIHLKMRYCWSHMPWKCMLKVTHIEFQLWRGFKYIKFGILYTRLQYMSLCSTSANNTNH